MFSQVLCNVTFMLALAGEGMGCVRPCTAFGPLKYAYARLAEIQLDRWAALCVPHKLLGLDDVESVKAAFASQGQLLTLCQL